MGEFIASDPRTLDITEAEIVVSAGRGMGSKENIRLVQELASARRIGRRDPRGRGPRLAAEGRQVGQTGKTVTPRLYVACGISGATAHTIGMKDAATIIAINTDAAAPIFKIADLAVQADVSGVLPALTARCRREPGGSA